MAQGYRSRPGSESTRATIIAAAEAVFADKGFAAARLQDVADRVGIRRPSIVYYFRNKRDLYEAVLNDLFSGLAARIQAAVDSPAPMPERIEAVVNAWVSYVGERPSLARIFLREIAEGLPARSPAMARYVAPISGVVEEAVRNGQQQGIFQPIDPMHFIITAVGGMVFFTCAIPVLSPSWPFDPLSPEQLHAYENELLEMARRWLGISRPALEQPAERMLRRGSR
jgi:TetR/AcrR family transcriptional regulator